MNEIAIPLLENMHGHLRQGPELKLTVPMAARYCHHYVAMGNTKPPILTSDSAVTYYGRIHQYTPPEDNHFSPIVAMKVREDTFPNMICRALEQGIQYFKFYPQAKTTNADDGIANYMTSNLLGCYREIAKGGGYALFHPEHPGKRWDDTECEYAFLGIFEAVYNYEPHLKMVWEHLTDTRVLPFILDMGERVGCTVTAHHLMLRLNDVLGQNHHLCRPPAKMMRDVETLRSVVTSGKHPRVMLGLDDAPHAVKNKECAKASCGVWSMPTAPHIIVQVFDEMNALTIPGTFALHQFVADNAQKFYGLLESDKKIYLKRQPCSVPFAFTIDGYAIQGYPSSEDYVPFMAGRILHWSVVAVK